MDYAKLSDLELYEICREFGAAALEARRKFLGTLPEVSRRELWKMHGFGSVFHFAAVLAGVSEEQVRLVLRTEKRVVDLPKLHQALVTGKISVNKIAKVVSIATPENQAELAALTANLSTRAVETLVRDAKENVHVNVNSQQLFTESNLDLKPETEARLRELQQKGLDLDALINEFLDQREVEIAEQKAELADIPAKSRYIPVRVKRLIAAEHGSKCAAPGCRREAKDFHHTARYSLTKNHDPHFLAPLCKAHHEIAHSVDVKVQHWRES